MDASPDFDAAPDDDDGADGDERAFAMRIPGWIFFVVPLLLVGGLVAAVAIAARSGDDEGGVERLSGPAAELPSVVAALDVLEPVDEEADGTTDRAMQIGLRIGVVGRGLVEVEDRTEFAREYGLLPDDAAERLGETLGAIQRELSPSSLGGGRVGEERHADTVFALALVWAAAPVLDPTADPADQALNVLPAAVPLAERGDDIVAAMTAGNMEQAAELLEPVLSEAGAAEVVSGLAGDLSDRFGNRNERDRLDAFQGAYNRELP